VTMGDEAVDAASARLTRTARGPGPSGLPPAAITRAELDASAERQRWADDRVSQQAKRATTDYRARPSRQLERAARSRCRHGGNRCRSCQARR
jgi:hypothetical protein